MAEAAPASRVKRRLSMKYTKYIRFAALLLLPALLAAPRLYSGGAAENTVPTPTVSKVIRVRHTIVKRAGAVITLPPYRNGDILKITGAALAAEDWAVLRNADKMYALILEGDTKDIPGRAFCDEAEELGCITITSISAPRILSVGDRAFSGNSSLSRISFPMAVEIGRKAFQACHSLRTVALPAAEEIQYGAFSGCHSLGSVSMPEAKYIGGHAFSSNPVLNHVSLPAAVQIDENAFQLCGALTKISLPAAIYIMEGAFFECESLAEVSLPQAVFIGNEAFMSCGRLADISLPEAVVICAFAFQGCDSLTDISLPKAEDIGRGAFLCCTSLTSVFMPNVVKVGKSAFYFCDSLRTVSLPNVLSIEDEAFVTTEGEVNITKESEGEPLLLELGARPEVGEGVFANRCRPVRLIVPKDERRGYARAVSAMGLPRGSRVVTAK